MSTQRLNSIVAAVRRHATENVPADTAIPELHIAWFTAPTALSSLIYNPCLCLVVQGSKEVRLSGDTYPIEAGRFLLVPVDLPVDARVSNASIDRPYVGLRISLDTRAIAELLADGSSAPAASTFSERGVAVSPIQPRVLDAVGRLVELLDEPDDVGPLGPLILREITHRLLTGPQGLRLRQIALSGAPANRIARAIRWLKNHFADPMRIEDLAARVGLSTSSFHLHFKNVTTMTPLQYQKRLRLQEARNLMLGKTLDAAEAAYRVGYESPSQFSREYRRMFGAPPRQDIDAVLSAASHQSQAV